MSTISDVRIAQAAQRAGFPLSEIPTAVAVSLAENRTADPEATHVNSDRHRSVDRGQWQINDYWNAHLFAIYKPWTDPDVNAQMAFEVFKEAGHQWTPWATYNDGDHLKYLARGRAAAAALNGVDAFNLHRYLKYIATAQSKDQLMHGRDVMALQREIGAEPDGYFGLKTDRALRRFQINNNLIADGIAGPNVARAFGWTFRG
jgi:peptidoglycan hydrolase-like protein with peptidoglycan-binding domain